MTHQPKKKKKKSTTIDISLEKHFKFFLLRFLEKFYIKISRVTLKRHIIGAVKPDTES